jgi:subtilisin-like proprotein convertase family protein
MKFMIRLRFLASAALAFVFWTHLSGPLIGQAGLRDSLEKLDRNQNGYIEPDEVTPLSRPYLERILKGRSRRSNFRFDRPYRISQIQESARVYYALENGVSGEDVRPEGEATVKAFGPDGKMPLVPEFGLGDIKFPYTQADLNEADNTLRRNDSNRDGHIDRREAARSRWTHRNPFDDDLDGDGRLSRLELGQRYARRRLLSGANDELIRRYMRLGSEVKSSVKEEPSRSSRSSWRQRGSVAWLGGSVLERFDRDKDGKLSETEATSVGVPFGRMDANRDGEITREELQSVVVELQKEAGEITEGLPGWFYEFDTDKDGQVAMSEFSEDWDDAKLAEFKEFDLNEDGLLTANEILKSSSVIGGTFRNEEAQVLPPRRTIISEIDVTDDFIINQLKVQISITHTYVSFLDAYLTGPEGQRVELFSQVGGSDDHFDRTIFDDQSQAPITKGKGPFNGTYRPKALDKKQPGLASFKGKSVKGVWQLVIRGTRNERFGMLNSWGLTVTPDKDAELAVESTPSAEAKPLGGLIDFLKK